MAYHRPAVALIEAGTLRRLDNEVSADFADADLIEQLNEPVGKPFRLLRHEMQSSVRPQGRARRLHEHFRNAEIRKVRRVGQHQVELSDRLDAPFGLQLSREPGYTVSGGAGFRTLDGSGVCVHRMDADITSAQSSRESHRSRAAAQIQHALAILNHL